MRRTPKLPARQLRQYFSLAFVAVLIAVIGAVPSVAQTAGTSFTEDALGNCNVLGSGVSGLAISNSGKIVYSGQCANSNVATTGEVLELYGGSGADDFVSFDVPGSFINGGISAITAAPDGTFWFVQSTFVLYTLQPTTWRIGHMTGAGHGVLFPVPAQIIPQESITIGPDGAVWFVSLDATTSAGQISRMAADGTVSTFPIPGPGAIALNTTLVSGPDGDLWFYVNSFNPTECLLYKLTTSGQFTAYQVPYATASQLGINTGAHTDFIVGPDGNLWIIGLTGYPFLPELVKVTTTGTFTPYVLPSSIGFVTTIAPGSDGAVWFGDYNAELGRLTTAGAFSSVPIPADDNLPNCLPGAATILKQGANGKLNFFIGGSAGYPGIVSGQYTCVLLGSYTPPGTQQAVAEPRPPKAKKPAHAFPVLTAFSGGAFGHGPSILGSALEEQPELFATPNTVVAPSQSGGPAGPSNFAGCFVVLVCQLTVYPKSGILYDSSYSANGGPPLVSWNGPTFRVRATNSNARSATGDSQSAVSWGFGPHSGECSVDDPASGQPLHLGARVDYLPNLDTPTTINFTLTPDPPYTPRLIGAICHYDLQLVLTTGSFKPQVLASQSAFVLVGFVGTPANENCTTASQCF